MIRVFRQSKSIKLEAVRRETRKWGVWSQSECAMKNPAL